MEDKLPEMVERVAKAIYAAQRLRPVTAGAWNMDDAWWDDSRWMRDQMICCARAAIIAMRQPTEAMAAAADGVDHHFYCVGDNGGREEDGFDAAPVWVAMIDEALK